MKTFDINSLNLDELLSSDELVTIDAGAAITIGLPFGMPEKAPGSTPAPGYTEATIIWSQIP